MAKKKVKQYITKFLEKTINDNKSLKVLKRKINGKINIISKLQKEHGQMTENKEEIIGTAENVYKD